MVFRLTAVDASARVAMRIVLGHVAAAHSLAFAQPVRASDWVRRSPI